MASVFARMASALDRPSAARRPALLLGLALARGRRTCTAWFRPAGITADFRRAYHTVGACGRRAEPVAVRLLPSWDPLLSGDRLVVAIDDTPTQRYGPEVEGAGIHHNPTPGPALEKFVYGHVWVTLAALARHEPRETVALPLLSERYLRAKDLAKMDPDRRVPFRTKLQVAAEQLRWLAGARARRPVPGGVGGGRWRLLQEAVPAAGGRAGDDGRRVTKLTKTFLATWRPAGGVSRVVLVHEEDHADNWRAYFCTKPEATAREILEAAAQRTAIEQTFKDSKEVWGAGQQQVGNLQAKVGAFNRNGWRYSLVEAWAWMAPEEELVDRANSSWDWQYRRPSHADKRKALQREVMRAEIEATLAGGPDQQQFREQGLRIAEPLEYQPLRISSSIFGSRAAS